MNSEAGLSSLGQRELAEQSWWSRIKWNLMERSSAALEERQLITPNNEPIKPAHQFNLLHSAPLPAAVILWMPHQQTTHFTTLFFHKTNFTSFSLWEVALAHNPFLQQWMIEQRKGSPSIQQINLFKTWSHHLVNQ